MSPKHLAISHVPSTHVHARAAHHTIAVGTASASGLEARPRTGRVFRRTLPVLSGLVMAGLSAVLVIAPQSRADAETYEQGYLAGQQYTADGAAASATRDGYGVTATQKPAAPVAKSAAKAQSSSSASSPSASTAAAPAVGTPDPGTAQAIAQGILQQRGLGDDQFACLVALWNRESHWNVYSHSKSGAYGIPQALPGSKMASVGSDWATNPTTQILWGLGYIDGRYGSPCGAWAHSQSSGWY